VYYDNDTDIHSDTPHSVGLLQTCDRTVADTTGRHLCPRQDSNPQSSTSERPQTHALGRVDTGIGIELYYSLFLDPTAPGTENLQYDTVVKKCKEVPLQTWSGLEDSRFHDNGTGS